MGPGGNWSTRIKPAVLGRDKLDNTLLTCDQGNFNQITAQSRNRTQVTEVRDTCTNTVPPVTNYLLLLIEREVWPSDLSYG